jgi:hypothetical protein
MHMKARKHGVVAEEECTEHGDRFGGDGEQEPRAVDACTEGGLSPEHDGDQRRVDEDDEQRKRAPPQNSLRMSTTCG